jgi:hypothetical protein
MQRSTAQHSTAQHSHWKAQLLTRLVERRGGESDLDTERGRFDRGGDLLRLRLLLRLRSPNESVAIC